MKYWILLATCMYVPACFSDVTI